MLHKFIKIHWKNKGFLPKDVKLDKSGSIIKSILKVYEIYQNKTKDLNAFDIKEATKIICGSARSMGFEVLE